MEQALLVHLMLSQGEHGSADERERISALEGKVEQAINSASAGEFDGSEFGGGECTLYMYGPDADALFDAVAPVLKLSPIAAGGYAIKRYGAAADPKASEAHVSW